MTNRTSTAVQQHAAHRSLARLAIVVAVAATAAGALLGIGPLGPGGSAEGDAVPDTPAAGTHGGQPYSNGYSGHVDFGYGPVWMPVQYPGGAAGLSWW